MLGYKISVIQNACFESGVLDVFQLEGQKTFPVISDSRPLFQPLEKSKKSLFTIVFAFPKKAT